MRICIVGDQDDLSAAYVGWLAERRGAEILRLPEDRYGIAWTFRVEEDHAKSRLELADGTFGLEDIQGAFVRLNPRPSVPGALGIPPDTEHVYALERRYGLHWLLDSAPFTVVNRPCAGRSNSSKPYQMMLLEGAGYRIPAWVVTNDPERAGDFMRSCRRGAVYKACSGLRCHVRWADEVLLERLGQGTSPVLIQEFIAGTDVRVHVVGSKVFGTEIRSEVIDYRFDGEDNEYRPVEVPSSLAGLCIEVTAREGLSLSGLDFRIDSDGTWWCLEVNPVPTFLPYESAAGHPIGDGILDLFGTLPRPARPVSPLSTLGPGP